MSVRTSLNHTQKMRRFRALAKDDRICRASELAVNLAQPLLPLFNKLPDVQRKEKRPARAWSARRAQP
jgi:hypothetical protein